MVQSTSSILGPGPSWVAIPIPPAGIFDWYAFWIIGY